MTKPGRVISSMMRIGAIAAAETFMTSAKVLKQNLTERRATLIQSWRRGRR